MKPAPPTVAEIEALAAELGLAPSAAELAFFARALGPLAQGVAALDAMPDDLPAPAYPRGPVETPPSERNPYNAWHVKVRIAGRPGGLLAGKTVVLKDNVLLAGAPIRNGATLLDGYLPEVDATVVTRILDAGGTIVGKAHCENWCVSAGSHTNVTGPVHNPRRRGRSAGGSSSGCAALVAAGEADMAIGGDQGGSIRIPASFCGIYGMKPTHGLVPYTGILPIEPTLDHAGPMTRSVRDNALLLEAIAGPDEYDARQRAPIVHPYAQLLGGGAAGLRIGLVREGFGARGAERDVDQKVRAAAEVFAKLGAEVETVSIPEHLEAGLACTALMLAGVENAFVSGDGVGIGRVDLYVPTLMDRLRDFRARAKDFSPVLKLLLLGGAWVRRTSGRRSYARAMQLGRRLRAAYDATLADHDLLLMPTTPMKATPLPAPDAPPEEILARAAEPIANTQPFDVTHHPALSLPCGMSEGLPVGMMLVGRHWDEPTLYRAAFAFEQAEDWTAL